MFAFLEFRGERDGAGKDSELREEVDKFGREAQSTRVIGDDI